MLHGVRWLRLRADARGQERLQLLVSADPPRGSASCCSEQASPPGTNDGSKFHLRPCSRSRSRTAARLGTRLYFPGRAQREAANSLNKESKSLTQKLLLCQNLLKILVFLDHLKSGHSLSLTEVFDVGKITLRVVSQPGNSAVHKTGVVQRDLPTNLNVILKRSGFLFKIMLL